MPDDARPPRVRGVAPGKVTTEPEATPAQGEPRFAAAPPSSILLPGDPPGRLRALEPGDWRLEQELSRTEDVPRWTFYPPDLSDDDARRRVEWSLARAAERRLFRYVVTDGLTAEPVGVVGTTIPGGVPEVFYALLPAGRGRGYATRAVRALVDWAVSAGQREVWLGTLAGNAASEAVARRAGFEAAGTVSAVRGGVVETATRWVVRGDG